MLVVLLGQDPTDSMIHLQSNKLEVHTSNLPGMSSTLRKTVTQFEHVFSFYSSDAAIWTIFGFKVHIISGSRLYLSIDMKKYNLGGKGWGGKF